MPQGVEEKPSSKPPPNEIVFDTDVLVAAARSRQGASFALVSSMPSLEFQPCLSVGLYTEWQEVLTRPENLPPGQTPEDVLRFLRYRRIYRKSISCGARSCRTRVMTLVLELAFAAGCRHILTHNVKDFHGSEQLGVAAVTPRDFLNLIRART